jgi:hypothetical protein
MGEKLADVEADASGADIATRLPASRPPITMSV